MVVQTKLESPTGPKLRRKNSTEPTMTFHSKAAIDEVYSMFNQPPRHETARNDSDEEDDDYSAAGESTGTGRISGTTSNFGDEDTIASAGTTGDENTRTGSQPDSVSPWSEFTASKHVPKIRGEKFRNNVSEEATEDVSSSQNQTQTSQISAFDTQAIAAIAGQQIGDLNTQVIAAMAGDFGEDEEKEVKTPISPVHPEEIEIRNKPKYVPLPPEDYEPTPLRPFRDPVEIAQNRLPFMTPIVEKTESSLGRSAIFDDKEQYVSKTPSRSNHLPVGIDKNSPSRLQIDELTLNSPTKGSGSPHKRKLSAGTAELQVLASSPQKPKSNFTGSNINSPGKNGQQVFAVTQPKFVKSSNAGSMNGGAKSTPAKGPIILDLQCNPIDPSIRKQILASTHPPTSSLPGFFDNSYQRSGKYPQIQNFAKKLAAAKPKASPRKNQAERVVTQAVQPLLTFNGSSRIYAIKRELGKGAFAPVYLVDSYDRDCADEGDDLHPTHHQNHSNKRSNLEAIKTEDPPSAWEFHILRLLRHRLGHMSRTMKSVILAHECHVFADECYLVLEYRSQGTLLDLVNGVKEENRKAGKSSADVGLDEVLAMFLSVELLRTVEECHAVGVLHGDLKADNCLCRFDGRELQEPYQRDGSFGWDTKGITLIDFGRGIDIRAFKPEVKFVADWASSAQDCAEIREARPWTWQIDYFGCAGVIHSLLFGRYIETVQVAGGGLGEKREWRLKETFKRYWAQGVWGEVFGLLLNPTMAGGGMPCLREMKRVREGMECWLEEEGERKALRGAVRRAEGLMNGRRK
jgi:checkpoint serine/threonine-protein kinase